MRMPALLALVALPSAAVAPGALAVSSAEASAWRASPAPRLRALSGAPATPSSPPAQRPAGTRQAARPAALPDLRIVAIEVAPTPLRLGAPATITVTVHNRSTAVAAGDIAVRVIHDRATPQPQPLRRELHYLAGDALAQVSFELTGAGVDGVGGVRDRASVADYTLFAGVDVFDAVEEASEADNAAWLRVGVCTGPEVPERADGLDNDCDGLVDEELGLLPDPGAALRELQRLQRRSARDAVPLIFGRSHMLAPLARRRAVRWRCEEGEWVALIAAPSARLRATGDEEEADTRWTLVDWNGGELRSGDLISLEGPAGEAVGASRDNGELVLLPGGVAGAASQYEESERFFTIVARRGENAGAAALAPGVTIRSGAAVVLVSPAGFFVAAEEGGGRELRADRRIAAGWETFVVVLDADGTDGPLNPRADAFNAAAGKAWGDYLARRAGVLTAEQVERLGVAFEHPQGHAGHHRP